MLNSLTTTEGDLIEPIHPGEILMEDFIVGFGITQNKLAVSMLGKLKIYAGPQHPHQAQQPESIELAAKRGRKKAAKAAS